MPVKGWKAVVIRDEVYEKAKAIFEERKGRFTSFTNWLSEYMLEKLEEDEYLYRYSPSLYFISAEGNTVYIKDHFEDRIVEVEIHDQGIGKRFLYCRHCKRDDCLHVGFCFAIREVNKILIEKGFKKPRVQ